jgi:hypothetical protein
MTKYFSDLVIEFEDLKSRIKLLKVDLEKSKTTGVWEGLGVKGAFKDCKSAIENNNEDELKNSIFRLGKIEEKIHYYLNQAPLQENLKPLPAPSKRAYNGDYGRLQKDEQTNIPKSCKIDSEPLAERVSSDEIWRRIENPTREELLEDIAYSRKWINLELEEYKKLNERLKFEERLAEAEKCEKENNLREASKILGDLVHSKGVLTNPAKPKRSTKKRR